MKSSLRYTETASADSTSDSSADRMISVLNGWSRNNWRPASTDSSSRTNGWSAPTIRCISSSIRSMSLGSERPTDVEVVVEAVGYGRADREGGTLEEPQHRLGQDVSSLSGA